MRGRLSPASVLLFVCVLALVVGLSIAGASAPSGGSGLGAAVTEINNGTSKVKEVAIAIGLLLSALLAIGLVVLLYTRTTGGK